MTGVLRTAESTSGDMKFAFPSYLKDQIMFDHLLDGESIEWHFDNERQVGVVASTRLEKFVHVKRAVVYGESNSSFRPPQQVRDNLPYLSNESDAAICFSEVPDEDYLFFFSEERLFKELDNRGGLFE
ncbi:hypothetical protein [Haloarcula argentinensis]|uniref:Uncharacterized protein n=1 Tax=Haloarcula argentinensis TaxID=43776 RepID=A0A847UPB1_HALAR|nr:hypothetical protein [Haloarcula argentinensis]NLV13228.1 hypothetical protein [Haloarcula argentinensis]